MTAREGGPEDFGPYFVPERPDARHRPWAELSERQAWTEPVGQARSVIAPADPDRQVADRVVVSTVFLGLAARVLSPVLGDVVLGRCPGRVSRYWRVDRGRILVAAAHESGPADPAPDGAGDLAGAVGLLDRLAADVSAGSSLSRHVLTGNIASSLVGAARIVCSVRPDLRERTAAVLPPLLEAGPLRGAGTLTTDDDGVPAWNRQSCCLFYRVPGAGVCGDCVLRADGGTRAARSRLR